jgi:hypothetical protein
MLPPSPAEAVLRRPLSPKHGFGLPRRKHGLRTPYFIGDDYYERHQNRYRFWPVEIRPARP